MKFKFFIAFCTIYIISIFSAGISARASLVLPQNALEYLEFENPIDIGVSSSTLAVLQSDQKIVLQNRQTAQTQTITLSFNPKKIYINDDYIFITNNSLNLFYKKFSDSNFTQFNNSVSTFALSQTHLVTLTGDMLNLYALTDLSSPISTAEQANISNLYFTSDSEYAFSQDGQKTAIGQASGNTYYISNHGFFKKQEQGDINLLPANFTALKLCDNMAYLLTQNKIIVYDILLQKEVMEVSSSSSSPSRLAGAVDLAVYENYIYALDAQNKKITITNLSQGFERSIALAFTPKHFAIYKNIFAITGANGGLTVLDKATGQVATSIDGNFLSVAISSSKIFALTAQDICEYSHSGEFLTSYQSAPGSAQIACDVGGQLFTVDDSGIIFKFNNFLPNLIESINLNGQAPIKLAIDFIGNPAVLTSQSNLHYDGQINSLEGVVSFANFYKSQSVYLLYRAKIEKSPNIEFVAIQNIDVLDNNFEPIANFELIKLKKHSLIFTFDLALPYQQREYEPTTLEYDLAVVVISRTETHIIFGGKVCAIAEISSFELGFVEYQTQQITQDLHAKTRFFAYKLPILHSFLQSNVEFGKDAQVTISSKITHPDLQTAYYQVIVDGKTLFVPENLVMQNVSQTPGALNYKTSTLKKGQIKLYQTPDIANSSFTIIQGDTTVYVLEYLDDFARIIYLENGQQIQGYVEKPYLYTKGQDTPRIILVVFTLMCAVGITTLYLIKKRNKN